MHLINEDSSAILIDMRIFIYISLFTTLAHGLGFQPHNFFQHSKLSDDVKAIILSQDKAVVSAAELQQDLKSQQLVADVHVCPDINVLLSTGYYNSAAPAASNVEFEHAIVLSDLVKRVSTTHKYLLLLHENMVCNNNFKKNIDLIHDNFQNAKPVIDVLHLCGVSTISGTAKPMKSYAVNNHFIFNKLPQSPNMDYALQTCGMLINLASLTVKLEAGKNLKIGNSVQSQQELVLALYQKSNKLSLAVEVLATDIFGTNADKSEPLSKSPPKAFQVSYYPPQFSSRPSFGKKIVLGIPTYRRPFCLIRSIISHLSVYPGIDVIVVDDSPSSHAIEIPVNKLTSDKNRFHYVRLEADSGVGMKRNAIVKKAFELHYEFVLMVDDDYVCLDFEHNHYHGPNLYSILDFVEKNNVDVAGLANRVDLSKNAAKIQHIGGKFHNPSTDSSELFIAPLKLEQNRNYNTDMKSSAPLCINADYVEQYMLVRVTSFID